MTPMPRVNIASSTGGGFGDDDGPEISRLELDSQANMPVVGKHAFILADSGKTVDVSPFAPEEYDSVRAPLVDAALLYTNPFDGTDYILVIRHAVYIPSMVINLIPPFMLREAGIQCNDVPKIHVKDPTVDDHALTFPETGFQIPLQLWGVFSYLVTSKPTEAQLLEPPDVYVLTPTTWNPHSDAYAFNEESMLDWEGNMRQPKDRPMRVVIEDLQDDVTMVSSLMVGAAEQQAIDSTFPTFTSRESLTDAPTH